MADWPTSRQKTGRYERGHSEVILPIDFLRLRSLYRCAVSYKIKMFYTPQTEPLAINCLWKVECERGKT